MESAALFTRGGLVRGWLGLGPVGVVAQTLLLDLGERTPMTVIVVVVCMFVLGMAILPATIGAPTYMKVGFPLLMIVPIVGTFSLPVGILTGVVSLIIIGYFKRKEDLA